jgi:hypothetical protein
MGIDRVWVLCTDPLNESEFILGTRSPTNKQEEGVSIWVAGSLGVVVFIFLEDIPWLNQ